MILCDVNVFVYAHNAGSPDHDDFRDWLSDVVNGEQAYGVSDVVLSGVIRVVTLARLWDRPSTLSEALAFVDVVRSGVGRFG